MSNRTLLTLAVLLAVLTAALLVDARRGDDARHGPLFPSWVTAPDSLRLVANGVSVVLKRDADGTWGRDGRRLPEETSRTIDALASGIATLKRGAIVETDVPPVRQATFGLREPSVSVGGRADGGARRLDIGRASPLGGDVYACVRDAVAADERPDVFLLPVSIRSLVIDVTRRVVRAPDVEAASSGESR